MLLSARKIESKQVGLHPRRGGLYYGQLRVQGEGSGFSVSGIGLTGLGKCLPICGYIRVKREWRIKWKSMETEMEPGVIWGLIGTSTNVLDLGSLYDYRTGYLKIDLKMTFIVIEASTVYSKLRTLSRSRFKGT